MQVVDFAPTLLDFIGSFQPDLSRRGQYTLSAAPGQIGTNSNANSPGESFAGLTGRKSLPATPPKGPWARQGRAVRNNRDITFGEYGTSRWVRDTNFKFRTTKEGLQELYNIHDPEELHNLIGNNTIKAQELNTELGAYFALYVDPTKSGWELAVSGSGQNLKIGWSEGSPPQAFQPYGSMAMYAHPGVTET